MGECWKGPGGGAGGPPSGTHGTPPSPELDRLLEERGEPQVRNGAKLADLLRRPRLTYADLAPFDPDRPDLAPAVASEAEITIKYEGYIQRQLRQVEEVKRLEAGLCLRTWTTSPSRDCGWRPAEAE